MLNLIVGTINTFLNIETITALLTTVTVGLSTWAALSAKKSATAAQSQYELSKEDSNLSKQPLLIPIESDYQASSPKINERLDGEGSIDKKFGDLTISLTNVSNSNAFNVVSYLNVRNLDEYLDFVVDNDIHDIWLESYSISKREKLSPNNQRYNEIQLKNYHNQSPIEYVSYVARNRISPKMTIGKNDCMDVAVNSYAQLILRDYINRKLNLTFDPDARLVDPEFVVISRFKTLDQLRTNSYSVLTYKVVLHQISFNSNEGISFRLMYEYESEKNIDN